jgi:tetratricopeptide (TPR) repeat protein
MVNTTLRAYLDELNLLLEQEALEEVIGHCRHILQHFPKNVETYRILGRALLEKARHDEAGDVFQRVLSALPDDFVSHLGLSSVAEEHGDIPTAIWHLERAYEQEPNNMALQGELKRLYERRDGSAPDRIQLTPSALVRIYAKGRLYEQAIGELRTALQQSPARVDLLLLQADILWNNDHLVEAGEVALRVLEKLPNDIEANKLLASLWLKSGRPSEAQPFLARLEQLDPFLTWETVQPDGKALPANAFQLPRLDWDARAAAALATDVPDWVSAISNVFEAPESIPLTGGVSNWLEDAAPAPSAKPPAEEPFVMPDWMSDMAPSSAPPADRAALPAADVPDWFKDSAPGVADTESAGGAILPDWFDEEETPAQSAPASASGLDASWLDDDLTAAPSGTQLPSGFTDLLMGGEPGRTNAPLDTESAALDAGIVPDWMADETPAPEAPQSLDALSWLSTGPLPPLDEPEQSPAASEPAPTSAGDVNLGDWLSSMPGTAEQSPAAEPAPAADLDMDWLSSMPGSQTSVPEPAPAADTGMDWLSSMPGMAEQPPAAEPAQASDLDMDWLSSMPGSQPSVAESAPAADTGMDWLSSIPSMAEQPPAAEPAQASDLDMDWLSSMPGSQPSVTESTPAADTGMDWLSSIPSMAEQPPAEPAQASDLDMDWLSSMPGSQPPAATPSAVGDLNLDDWLSGTPAGESGTTPVEPINTDMDWLSSMPGTAEQPSAAESPAQGDGIFELRGRADTTDDWYSSQPLATEEPAPESDPMAWLHSYTPGETEASGESAELSSLGDNGFGGAAEEEPLAQADTPDWLSAIRPSATQSIDAETPLEELDFSAALGSSEEAAPNWPATSEETPAPAQDDWLSTLGTAQPSEPAKPGTGSLDWLAQSPGAPPSQPAVELEDDWLASFEAGPASASAVTQEPPTQASAPEEETSMDWFGLKPPEEPVSPAQAAPAQDDWLGSLGFSQQEETASAEPVDNAPAWMQEEPATPSTPGAESSDWPVSDAKERFDGLLKRGGERTSELRVVKNTGILDPGVLPDWMAAFGGEETPQAESSSTAESVPGWMSETAPGSPSDSPSTTSDGLDFSSLDAPEQPSGEVPDWMSAMAPTNQASASTPVDDLDFSSLEASWSGGDQSTTDEKPAQDPFAKSADLVNTGMSAGSQSAAPATPFSFDRMPAWMRKKGASQKASGEELPGWLTKPDDSSGSKDDDTPDWLKE